MRQPINDVQNTQLAQLQKDLLLKFIKDTIEQNTNTMPTHLGAIGYLIKRLDIKVLDESMKQELGILNTQVKVAKNKSVAAKNCIEVFEFIKKEIALNNKEQKTFA